MARLSVGASRPRCALALAAALLLAGCAAGSDAIATSRASSDADLTGVWEGFAVDDCTFRKVNLAQCAGTVHVMLTLIQQESAVSGFYKCTAGTIACQREEEAGRIISGQSAARRLGFRVMLPDGGSCIYRSLWRDNVIDGSYFCVGGEIILGRGWFTVERSY